MVAKSIICLLHLELFYHVFCRACTALNERVQDSNKQLIQGGGTILLLHSELAHQTFSPMQLGMQECIIHASVEMQQKQERRFCQAILLQLKQNPNQDDKVIPRRRNGNTNVRRLIVLSIFITKHLKFIPVVRLV